MRPIKITRTNGKSNGEVIVEFVHSATPETTFSYDELRAELQKDTRQKYDNSAVCAVVRQANLTLLRDHQRELRNVRNVGFRLVPAKEHMDLAKIRNGKADRQIRRALDSLQHVRWDEMDENSRRAHEGQLLLTAAIYAHTAALRKRQSEHERLVAAELNGINERLKRGGL